MNRECTRHDWCSFGKLCKSSEINSPLSELLSNKDQCTRAHYVGWFRHKELHRETPQWAGLFLGHLSNREDSDLQSFSSRSSLAQGQIPHNSIVGMATIDALIAAVLTILPEIAHNPRSLIQGKTPIRTTRARQEANGASPTGEG